MLSENEIIDLKKSSRNLTHENLLASEKRVGELSDEFTRLEVQISAILFAFMGFFSGFFNATREENLATVILRKSSVKVIVVLVFSSLILSLVCGLVHIKRKEYFWCGQMRKRNLRFRKWEQTVKNTDISLEQALAYHEGTANGSDIEESPNWTWVLQTISLGIAVIGIFILLMIFLF